MKSQAGKSEKGMSSKGTMENLGSEIELTQTSFPLKGEECNPERQSDFIPQIEKEEELEPLNQEKWDSERQSGL
jgi:hypothetical protein